MFDFAPRNHFPIGKTILCVDSINHCIEKGLIKINLPSIDKIPERQKSLFTEGKVYPVDSFEITKSGDSAPALFIRVLGDDSILETVANHQSDGTIFTEEDFIGYKTQMDDIVDERREKEYQEGLKKGLEELRSCTKSLFENPIELSEGDIVVYRKDIFTKEGAKDLSPNPMVVLKFSTVPVNEVTVGSVLVAGLDSSGALQIWRSPIYDFKIVGKLDEDEVDKMNQFVRKNLN